MVFHLKKLESPSPKDALYQDCLKLAQWFWRRRVFNLINVFSLFSNYLPRGKGRGPSFEQTWIPFIQECFVLSLVEIGSVVLEKKIFKFCQYIFAILLLYVIIFPWKRWDPSFEQTWIPFTQGCFVPSLVEIGQSFWRRRLSRFVNVFLLLSLFGKRCGPSFEQFRIPFTQ